MTHPNHTTAGRSRKTGHAALMRAKYALSVEGNTTGLTSGPPLCRQQGPIGEPRCREVQGAPDNFRGRFGTHRIEMKRKMPTFLSLFFQVFRSFLSGNDVATNLKWLMAQNSVVLMPTPLKESWLMEGLLRPWVHYVPLDDPAEARARVAWMQAHEEDCLRIVRNANAWMAAITNQTTWNGDVQRVMRHALELPDVAGDVRSRKG